MLSAGSLIAFAVTAWLSGSVEPGVIALNEFLAICGLYSLILLLFRRLKLLTWAPKPSVISTLALPAVLYVSVSNQDI